MNYFKRLFLHNREFILKEIFEIKELMHMLMKHRHTGQNWTGEEKKEIRMHFKNISKVVPAAIVFLLPGGSLLLPFVVDALDKRIADRSYTNNTSEVLITEEKR